MKFGRLVVCAVMLSFAANAGPIIIGGDDLNDHGSRSGNTNQLGWLYIQNALNSINGSVTRPGTLTSRIAVLGSSDPGPGNYSFGGGSAVLSAADNLGLSTAFWDGAAQVSTFFSGLASGTINPGIIYLPGDQTSNALDSSEGAVLTANAAALNAFVASGGGLMSHGAANNTAQGWLTTLLPGLMLSTACQADPGATLTAAGQALFPGLTNADVDSGPCHGSYSGNFGGLTTLAVDQQSRAFIIGGNQQGGSITDPGTGIPEPFSMMLTGSGLALLGWRRVRRNRA